MENDNKTTYCKYLRGKNPYGILEGGENPWLIPFESNTITWCVKSSGSCGPDNGLVCPANCQEGRSCYVSVE